MCAVSLGAAESSGVARVGPSRVWYGVAVAVFVGSLIPVFFLARDAFDTLSLSVDPIGEDGTFEVHDRQVSVFAPPDVSARVAIPGRGPPRAGGEPISLSQLGEATINSYESVGDLPEDLAAGTYRLRCTDGNSVVDLDGFGTQSTEGWGRAILEVVLAAIIGIFAGLIGITIAVITAVRRSSARRRRLRPPPYGSGGFPSAPTPMA
jgi:hypothetical protein